MKLSRNRKGEIQLPFFGISSVQSSSRCQYYIGKWKYNSPWQWIKTLHYLNGKICVICDWRRKKQPRLEASFLYSTGSIISPVAQIRLLYPKNVGPVCGHLPPTLQMTLEASADLSSLYSLTIKFSILYILMDWNWLKHNQFLLLSLPMLLPLCSHHPE